MSTRPSTSDWPDDDALADAYLRRSARAKLRRLSGLIVLCALLLAVLVLIYSQGWYSGSGAGGAGWVFVGIGVAAAAIAAVVIDIVYRKEL
ncbi:hypothetical protein [Amycolatopsis nivea]|uniref:hypothetical protein n=1 Tax=Amycolatopsis nivea TaxID=1644109 RepID=UPI0010705C24|nr:hypothetical protein [Amycolatopsis nivea]